MYDVNSPKEYFKNINKIGDNMSGPIRKARIEALISSWSIFTFWIFFFGLIGILAAGWFNVFDWWIWFVGGILFIFAISATIKFIADRRGRKPRFTSMITSWMFFLFMFLLFYIVGVLTAGWFDYGDWWVWFLIGLFLLGAITSTIRFFVYSSSYDDYGREITKTTFTVEASPKAETIFCKSCGAKVEGQEKFCANCGAPID
ncbi:MAG: zinc ribbon domain-containing protein [Asgard group archaeon]|nr:zinc ribbon domain-containing protein [Asgard group archaeon]